MMKHLAVINCNTGELEVFIDFKLTDSDEIEEHLSEIDFNLNEISWGLVDKISIT